MAGPDRRRFVTFAVVAIGVIAAGVGLALHRRGNKRRKQSTRQPAGESAELDERAHSPVSVENVRICPAAAIDSGGERIQEVEDNNVSSAAGGNMILPDGGNSRFLTANGVKEDLQEYGRATEGGFGTVIFLVSRSKPEDKFALKKAKDTPAGRRQMHHEATFFAGMCHLPPLHNVVRVADVVVSPTPMLLMFREESTLADMLGGGGSTNIADVARVLDGVLTGVDALYGAGFFHRDIKPDNILIGKDGRGVLADFGLHMTTTAAFDGEGLGDGTPEYAAPETALEGWSLRAETYSTFACFAEAILGRCLFGGEELFAAKKERSADLEAVQEDTAEDVGYFHDEVTRLMTAVGNDEGTEEEDLLQDLEEVEEDLASALRKMEKVNVQLWRLKLNVGSWVPGEAALAELRRMGSPLSFFVSSEEGSGDDLSSRHVAACREAKAQPGKLFEEGWPNWLPSSSKFDLKEEIRRTMDFLIGAGVLALDPGARPPTVESAKKVLMAAADVYKKGNT